MSAMGYWCYRHEQRKDVCEGCAEDRKMIWRFVLAVMWVVSLVIARYAFW